MMISHQLFLFVNINVIHFSDIILFYSKRFKQREANLYSYISVLQINLTAINLEKEKISYKGLIK